MTLRNWFGWRCRLGRCPCRNYSDANGAGGKCIDCGKIVGYLTNAELRELADEELKP